MIWSRSILRTIRKNLTVGFSPTLLFIDAKAGSVAISGRSNKQVSAACENSKLVPCEDPLSTVVHYANGELNSYVDELVNVFPSTSVSLSSQEESP